MTVHDWDHLIQKDRVHRRVYADPSLFELEMANLFGGVWTYLCHESELPAVNSFKTVKLGLRPLIVTKDRNGKIHALANRCSHRGALLCREQSGVKSRFSCPYHGWTFANDGATIGVTFPQLYGDTFDKAHYNLAKIARVESYRGFIFATLNAAMPSLREYLGVAAEYIDMFVDRAPGKQIIVQSGAYRGRYHGNWKLAWDNAADGYHVSFAHRSLVEMTRRRDGGDKGASYMGKGPDESPMYCKQFPNGHTFLHHRPGMGPSLWQRVRPTPGAEACQESMMADLGKAEAAEMLELVPGFGMNLNIFPNLMIIANQIQVVEPLSFDQTQLTWYATTLKGVDARVNTLRMRVAEDFPNFGEVDDLEMFELCWEGLQISEVEWINTNRGALRPDAEVRDADGVRTVTATDEAPLRGYLQAYKAHMQKDVSLAFT